MRRGDKERDPRRRIGWKHWKEDTADTKRRKTSENTGRRQRSLSENDPENKADQKYHSTSRKEERTPEDRRCRQRRHQQQERGRRQTHGGIPPRKYKNDINRKNRMKRKRRGGTNPINKADQQRGQPQKRKENATETTRERKAEKASTEINIRARKKRMERPPARTAASAGKPKTVTNTADQRIRRRKREAGENQKNPTTLRRQGTNNKTNRRKRLRHMEKTHNPPRGTSANNR